MEPGSSSGTKSISRKFRKEEKDKEGPLLYFCLRLSFLLNILIIRIIP
ncbi:Uncharacterised protein [uncultured Clostridium sp.]|nr:Uncharacterised protein [uncultured Clostridium sp.]